MCSSSTDMLTTFISISRTTNHFATSPPSNLKEILLGGRRIVARQSLAFFDRAIEIPNYRFAGRQFNSYTDISYFHPLKNHALVFGFSSAYDNFNEKTKRTAVRFRVMSVA